MVRAVAGALRDMDFIQNVLNGMASRRPRRMPCVTPGTI